MKCEVRGKAHAEVLWILTAITPSDVVDDSRVKVSTSPSEGKRNGIADSGKVCYPYHKSKRCEGTGDEWDSEGG